MYVLQFSIFRSLIFGTLLTKLHSHSILERISLFIFIFLLIMRIISQKPPFFNTLRFISLLPDTNIKENKKYEPINRFIFFYFPNLTIFNTLKEFDENLSWCPKWDCTTRVGKIIHRIIFTFVSAGPRPARNLATSFSSPTLKIKNKEPQKKSVFLYFWCDNETRLRKMYLNYHS